jgi:hypothetical protein
LLEEFERKYKKMFDHMKEYKSNIWQKFKQLPDGDQKNPELMKRSISGSRLILPAALFELYKLYEYSWKWEQ